jgi:hypothetical protein
MVKRPDSNEVVLDNLALTAPTQPVRSPMYAPNTHFPHTRCRSTEFHVIYKACTPGLAFVLRASLPNCYYPHARRWPRQQPRQHGWENASYCTRTVISTVALRLGTLSIPLLCLLEEPARPAKSSIAVHRASKSVMAREASSSV